MTESFAHRSQVVGDNAPANPAFESLLTMVSAAIEPVLAFDDADPTFDAGMESTATSEPALSFVLAASLRFTPGLGKNDALHP